jgi:hypothetical protein
MRRGNVRMRIESVENGFVLYEEQWEGEDQYHRSWQSRQTWVCQSEEIVMSMLQDWLTKLSQEV